MVSFPAKGYWEKKRQLGGVETVSKTQKFKSNPGEREEKGFIYLLVAQGAKWEMLS